jgi:methionyl-tRNA formyltransferase
MSRPRIHLACATRRGVRFLGRLAALVPEADLVVFSFREEPHEPPFLDDLAAACHRHGAGLHVGRQLGADEWEEVWEEGFDLLLAVSWRYLIPPRVFRRARRGAYVFHDSLLPAYRGFSPTVWAMINGEDHTGVTLFAMAEEFDAGDVIDQRRVPIGADETIAEVMEGVTDTYLSLLESNLPALLDGTAHLTPQDEAAATYTCRLLPEDCEIDWRRSSRQIHDLVRGYTRPYPGAFTWLDGQRLTVWETRRLDGARWVGRVPGRVAEVRPGVGSVVLTGDGALLLTRVQPEGGDEVVAAGILDRLSHTLGIRGER